MAKIIRANPRPIEKMHLQIPAKVNIVCRIPYMHPVGKWGFGAGICGDIGVESRVEVQARCPDRRREMQGQAVGKL